MRRVSNLNTLRIGIFGTWYSLWYDKEYYTFLVYKDYKLIEYLNSIFYRLRLPTSHFYLNRINNNYYYIQSNIYLIRPSFNRFTKLLYSNKSVFKYISLLEYLFDFSLLVPNNLLRSKNYIDEILFKSESNKNINCLYYKYYSLYNINSIYSSRSMNFKYIYEYIYYINNIYLLNNKNKIRYILLKDNNNNIHFKQLNESNSVLLFNNYFNINKTSLFNQKRFGRVKSFLASFISIFNNKQSLFFFYINLNFSYLLEIVNSFFIKNFIRLYNFFFFISFFFYPLNSYYHFIKLYYHFFFFYKKNYIYRNYKFKIYKNLNSLNINKLSDSLSIINKKSYFSYSSRAFKNKFKDSFRNKTYLNYKLNKFIIACLNNNYGFISLFYLKDFNLTSKEFPNNSVRITRDVIDMVYYKKINKFNSFIKRVLNYFKKKFFTFFSYFVELTIFNYTGVSSIFLPTYYTKKFPPFDTKLLVDYIIFNLKRKHRISRVLNRIANIQKRLNRSSRRIFIPLFNEMNKINKNYIVNNKYSSFFNFNNLFNIVFFNKIYNKELLKKFNPVSGIRIEFSGPPKKAQMSKTVAYHNIIHDHKLVGKMPTHTVYADIHYYQSYVKLKRSTFGIKVWLFYHTRILNCNNVNKTLL